MITRETITRPTTTDFFFDPICPWTWLTSRWLLEVARARDFEVIWRTFSLAELNGGVENMPEQYQEGGRFSVRVLRVMEALRAAGLNDRIGALYTEVGTRLHVQGEAPRMDLLRAAAEASDTSSYLGAADDPYWDGPVGESTALAMSLAGPDVGSPVLRVGDHDRGVYGPVVSPVPQGADALKVWDAMMTLGEVPAFYELKRGRAGAPQIQPVEEEAATGRV